MRSRWPESAGVAFLRQCFTAPRCQVSGSAWKATYSSHIPPRYRRHTPISSQQQRRYQTQSNNGTNDDTHASQYSPSKIEPTRFQAHQPNLARRPNENREHPYNGQHSYAILGGGITGLASAHYLSRQFPSAKITLYEGSGRLGGWLRTERIEIDGGNVLFEHGPRTLRRPTGASGYTTLELIQNLSLQNELLMTSMYSTASQNRFIYYPDHLVPMPTPVDGLSTNIYRFFTEGVFEGLVAGIGGEFRRPLHSDGLEDESVANFFQRRLGTPKIGDNIISAILHGIYAGDINQLSIKSLFPRMWHIEKRGKSLTDGYLTPLFEQSKVLEERDLRLLESLRTKLEQPLLDRFDGASMFTFKNGLTTLSSALEKSLRANPNVTLKVGEEVKSLESISGTNGVTITTAQNQPPAEYRKVISTIPGRNLATLAAGALPSLASTHAVTVMVVNLYYPNPDILPERGFGYLIPRSIPFEQNPERALGVIFSSDTVKGQDTDSGTKVTVMLGGHWWDSFESYPDEEEGIAMAKSVLERHLHIEQKPTVARAALHRECIPQYTVGHDARMKRTHGQLLRKFNGNVLVAGNSYTGVSVHDCIRSARDAAMNLENDMVSTGLEQFTTPRKFLQLKSSMTLKQKLLKRLGGS